MTKNSKKKSTRCRHVWGEEKADGFADEHRACLKCGAIRFRGERYAYGSRARKIK